MQLLELLPIDKVHAQRWQLRKFDMMGALFLQDDEIELFLALLVYVCMSAEIMNSKFVRHRPSSARVAIISQPTRISFKFWFLPPLGHTLRQFIFFRKKKLVGDFVRIFLVFVNMGPYGSKNFKTLLLVQITAKKFSNFP